jgi:hypothetical protein
MSEDRIAVLEERLAAVEQAVAKLQAARPATAPAPRKDPLEGHPLLWQSITDPNKLAEMEAEIDRKLGIAGIEPLAPDKVRQMMIEEDGLDSKGTEFSRGIIEMREERG